MPTTGYHVGELLALKKRFGQFDPEIENPDPTDKSHYLWVLDPGYLGMLCEYEFGSPNAPTPIPDRYIVAVPGMVHMLSYTLDQIRDWWEPVPRHVWDPLWEHFSKMVDHAVLLDRP